MVGYSHTRSSEMHKKNGEVTGECRQRRQDTWSRDVT